TAKGGHASAHTLDNTGPRWFLVLEFDEGDFDQHAAILMHLSTKAPFVLAVDLDAPRRIHRGETITLNYTAKRKNGFIGKIHTEMAAPGEVEGLRVRGVTFVGQTETGTLQIIANKDAPLGQQPFLRLEGVGTVEDEPVYLGAVFLNLEIVE
ncbi:MAG: hypothetical protein QF805_14995, partial [Pirellulaceae bacterium]|nr:hypothetical protein [Pirellulaceae bacterium]